MTNLAHELERRLQLAKDHGPLSESREVYIPSSWLPELLASLTGEGEPVAWRRRGSNLRWEYRDDGSTSVVFVDWHALYTRPPVACPDREAVAKLLRMNLATMEEQRRRILRWNKSTAEIDGALGETQRAILALSASGGGE